MFCRSRSAINIALLTERWLGAENNAPMIRRVKGEENHSARAYEKVMSVKNKYPRGWNAAWIRKVIEYYDSQTEDEEAAEIEAALAGTTMEVPKALVPVVRDLIATRKFTSARRSRRVSAG